MKSIINKITCMLLNTVLAIVMILGIVAAFTGCGDNGGNSTPPVVEPDKFYDDWVNGIEIYRGADVTDQQVEDMIEELYNILNNSQKIRLANHITEIHVTKNSGQISHEGDVLYVGYDADIADIKSYLYNEGLLAEPVPDVFYADWILGIKFYKGDVTDQQVDDMIAEFDGNLSNALKIKLANHITEIHVTKNSGQISHEGDVLSVGYDADITQIKLYLLNEGFFAKNQPKDGIIVVKVNGTVDAVMSAKLNRYKQPYQMMNEKQA